VISILANAKVWSECLTDRRDKKKDASSNDVVVKAIEIARLRPLLDGSRQYEEQANTGSVCGTF
jgi:hypothetical protein